MKDINKIVADLKNLIDENGPDYLSKEPWNVYKGLLKNGHSNKISSQILYYLVNGIETEKEGGNLSEKIQKKLSLNKKAADEMAGIFLNLYSPSNETEWEESDKKGLKQFLSGAVSFNWKGFSSWDAGNGTVDCHYSADIQISPTDKILSNKKFSALLSKNPFVKKEAIEDFFKKEAKSFLDEEFEEYCTCDDYYEPVVEDFEIDYYLNDWCKKNGFKLISVKGHGYADDFEPKGRNYW